MISHYTFQPNVLEFNDPKLALVLQVVGVHISQAVFKQLPDTLQMHFVAVERNLASDDQKPTEKEKKNA